MQFTPRRGAIRVHFADFSSATRTRRPLRPVMAVMCAGIGAFGWAHNAKFDRPMCEAIWPFFRNFNWACSCTQIPWKEEGHECVKLGYLLNDYGHFHNGHRANAVSSRTTDQPA